MHMRNNRWTMAFALGLGLWLPVFARADEDDSKPAKTGNWFTRIFSRDGDAKKKEKAAKKEDAAALSPAVVRQKAQWELMRRQEVCDKLRQIAVETGDKELSRKADALDQRAWDVYVQQTGGIKSNPSADEQFLESRLGMQAAQRSQDPGTVNGTASATLAGRAAARKD
jgi:hypothetical protein